MSVGIAPEAALRPGIFDPFALLVTYYLRKSFWLVLLLGGTIALVTNRLDDFEPSIEFLDKFESQVLSPLFVLFLALALKIGAAFVALALAYPLARRHQLATPSRTGVIARWIDLAVDRFLLTRSYSLLRWTYPVRAIAIERLGTTGRWMSYLGPIVNTANVVLFVVFAVAFTSV